MNWDRNSILRIIRRDKVKVSNLINLQLRDFFDFRYLIADVFTDQRRKLCILLSLQSIDPVIVFVEFVIAVS
jgi:hypothetical protein